MPSEPVDPEPDYRFTLANERTFLSWLRTGLALLAAAVAFAGLVPGLGPAWLRSAVVGLLLALAATTTVGAYARWVAVERAIRAGRPLPRNGYAALIAAGLVVVVAAVAVLVVLDIRG